LRFGGEKRNVKLINMAAQPPKPYTELQKSPDIPNVNEDETMVSVLGKMVGLQPDIHSKFFFFPSRLFFA
jgi:hypothetical protein